MTRRARRLRELYKTLGLRKLLARLGRRAVATVYARRTELLFVKQLDPARSPHPATGGLRIEAITPEHAPLLKRFNARHRTTKKVVASTAYLRHAYRGFLAFADQEVVGYWWWVSPTTDPDVTHPNVGRFALALEDDEVFAFDYFIAPEHRARGAAVTFLSLIYVALAAEGCRAIWGSVDANNVAARWVYKLHGNVVVRCATGHELFSTVLFQDRAVFVRNTRWSATHPFDYRPLLSLRRACGPRGAVVAREVATGGV